MWSLWVVWEEPSRKLSRAQESHLFGEKDLELSVIQVKVGDFSKGEKAEQNENRAEGRMLEHSTIEEANKTTDQKRQCEEMFRKAGRESQEVGSMRRRELPSVLSGVGQWEAE